MLARRLRPPALDEYGLSGALESAAADLGLNASVAVEPVALPDLLEVGLYRIAVEALANIARHAGTIVARVEVVLTGGEVTLEVADDGAGLTGSGIGVGIAAMNERASELGGRLTVTSAVDGGTLVTARIPLLVEGES